MLLESLEVARQVVCGSAWDLSDIDGALSDKSSEMLYMAAMKLPYWPGIPIFSFWHRTVGFLARSEITIEPSL